MKGQYRYHKIPYSRIATFDVYSIGMKKHHVSALLELDVTNSREKLRQLKRNGNQASFNAWMIKVISKSIQNHPEVAGYIVNKKKMVTFEDINISVVVEKELNGKKVPIPLVIKKTNEKSIMEITVEIAEAKDYAFSNRDIVLNKNSKLYERLYYFLPGILRRTIWIIMLRFPGVAYRKMGNAVITSLGMIGIINGWFIHKSVHPVSFGMGSIIKKPRVVNNEIKAREILNMTILMDHDVVDGAPMVRFINDFTRFVEGGYGL